MASFRILALALACAASFPSGSYAQQQAPQQGSPTASGQAKPGTETVQLSGIDLAILIKSAVVALHQANVTGNYSVLRDLGSPLFREKFDQAQLTAIFNSLRQRGINLAPALLLNPTLAKQPDLTDLGTLTLVGAFPTQPLQIQFQIVYQRVGQGWRIDGLAVDAVPVDGVAQAQAAQPQAQTAPPAEQPKTAQADDKSKPKEKKKEREKKKAE